MTPGSRLGATLATAVVLLCTAGCGSDSDPTPTPTPTRTVAPARSIGALLAPYCEIQGLRRLIAAGQVAPEDLPTSVGGTRVDLTEVAGTPRIIDFTRRPVADLDTFRDRLFASPALDDVQIDRTEQRDCLRTTTDADVEKSQGGPGYLAGR